MSAVRDDTDPNKTVKAQGMSVVRVDVNLSYTCQGRGMPVLPSIDH